MGGSCLFPADALTLPFPCQMSVFLYILAARASCAAQRQGFEKKGPV